MESLKDAEQAKIIKETDKHKKQGAKSADQAEEMPLEEMMEELEEKMKQLENESISLEDSFHLYEEGMDMIQRCNDKIDRVEKKVLQIGKNRSLQEMNEV